LQKPQAAHANSLGSACLPTHGEELGLLFEERIEFGVALGDVAEPIGHIAIWREGSYLKEALPFTFDLLPISGGEHSFCKAFAMVGSYQFVFQ
jgi:hypothetical protein